MNMWDCLIVGNYPTKRPKFAVAKRQGIDSNMLTGVGANVGKG